MIIDKIRKTARAGPGALVQSAVARYYRALHRAAGQENRPVFFDIDTTAPALLELDRNYLTIRSEVEALLKKGLNLPRYHDLDPRQAGISGNTEKKWKVFVLYQMGAKPKANRALCPKTAALLDRIPNLFEAFFSILEAGKSIPAHNGPYPGYLRYHLGLLVPKENPPRIRVKEQFHTWQEGTSVLFDDSWNHEVFNESKEDRVVLLVDILRPLPWHLHVMNWFFAKVVLRVSYAAGVLKNLEQFR